MILRQQVLRAFALGLIQVGGLWECDGDGLGKGGSAMTRALLSPADIDECANETLCGSHAFCDNTDGSFRCLCDSGYENLPPGQDCVGKSHSVLLARCLHADPVPVPVSPAHGSLQPLCCTDQSVHISVGVSLPGRGWEKSFPCGSLRIPSNGRCSQVGGAMSKGKRGK